MTTTIPTITLAFHRPVPAVDVRPGEYVAGVSFLPADAAPEAVEAAVMLVDEVRYRTDGVEFYLRRHGWERRSRIVADTGATVQVVAGPSVAADLVRLLLSGGSANLGEWTPAAGFHDVDGAERSARRVVAMQVDNGATPLDPTMQAFEDARLGLVPNPDIPEGDPSHVQ